MSREVVFLRWCSMCESDGAERVEAVESYTVAVVKGEVRPGPRVLDVCDAHAEELRSFAVMVAKHSIPLDPKAKPSPVAPAIAIAVATGGSVVECLVCHESKSRASIVAHIWSVHHKNDRPPQPKRCPDCGAPFAPAGMGIHRSNVHGYNPLAEAYEGLIDR